MKLKLLGFIFSNHTSKEALYVERRIFGRTSGCDRAVMHFPFPYLHLNDGAHKGDWCATCFFAGYVLENMARKNLYS